MRKRKKEEKQKIATLLLLLNVGEKLKYFLFYFSISFVEKCILFLTYPDSQKNLEIAFCFVYLFQFFCGLNVRRTKNRDEVYCFCNVHLKSFVYRDKQF
jgi:hypothetical protein